MCEEKSILTASSGSNSQTLSWRGRAVEISWIRTTRTLYCPAMMRREFIPDPREHDGLASMETPSLHRYAYGMWPAPVF